MVSTTPSNRWLVGWAGDNLEMLGADGYFEHVNDDGTIVLGSGTWASKKNDLLAALATIGKSYTDDQVIIDMHGYTRGETIENFSQEYITIPV